jgi:hypothetical protein
MCFEVKPAQVKTIELLSFTTRWSNWHPDRQFCNRIWLTRDPFSLPDIFSLCPSDPQHTG